MTRIAQLRRTFVSVVIPLSLILIVTLGAATETAYAKKGKPRCDRGEVQSALQALPVGLFTVDQTKAGLGAGSEPCWYGVFLDGESYTFHSSDLILGSVANFIPLELLDVTHQEAVDLLLTAEDRVFLGPAGTPVDQLVEQELTLTTFKSAMHPTYGHIVYQNKGFITQLEPGEYISYNVWRWPLLIGDETETATVHLTILP